METIPRLFGVQDHRFTYEYAQTPGYRFCQDSIIFPRFVADWLRERELGPGFRALDLCSGCGVIGFELAHHEPRVERMDFLEIQEEFREPFERNLEITGRGADRFRFLHGDFRGLAAAAAAESYDLIVANPPYFFAGDGSLSPSEHQNRCRFFLDGSLRELVVGVANALSRGGDAFILVKPGTCHGRDAFRDLQLWLGTWATSFDASAAEKFELHARRAADLRGTDIVHITKR